MSLPSKDDNDIKTMPIMDNDDPMSLRKRQMVVPTLEALRGQNLPYYQRR
jgi:hypothetical protein